MSLQDSPKFGRPLEKIALRVSLIVLVAAASLTAACASDKGASTPTLTPETRTPIAGKVLTPESGKEISASADAVLISGLLKKYFKQDADPLLKKVKDPKVLESVLTSTLMGKDGEIMGYDFVVDSSLFINVIREGEKILATNISFQVGTDGNIASKKNPYPKLEFVETNVSRLLKANVGTWSVNPRSKSQIVAYPNDGSIIVINNIDGSYEWGMDVEISSNKPK